MYCIFLRHIQVSGYVQLKRVPEFLTKYKIGTLEKLLQLAQYAEAGCYYKKKVCWKVLQIQEI